MADQNRPHSWADVEGELASRAHRRLERQKETRLKNFVDSLRGQDLDMRTAQGDVGTRAEEESAFHPHAERGLKRELARAATNEAEAWERAVENDVVDQ